MGKLIIICLLLVAAAWIGWEMHQDSGYIFLSFRNWQIETSLWMAVLLILILFIVLYAVIRLIIRTSHWPRQLRLWRQAHNQRRAQRLSELAGCALIEEKWALAEEYFHKAALQINLPLLCYLGAAIAAQAQNAGLRRDEYLHKAYVAVPEAEIPVAILQAKLQIQGQQWPEATVTIEKLQSIIPQHPVIKELLHILNQQPEG